MRMFSVGNVSVLGLTVSLFAGGASAQLAADMKLEDAGFVMRRADTAEKMALVRRLPPHRFIARVKNGQRYYVYADPQTCQCVFVGNEKALQAARDMRSKVPQPDNVPASGTNLERYVANDMDRDLSDVIDDGNILDWNF